jgi:hypothetical protein
VIGFHNSLLRLTERVVSNNMRNDSMIAALKAEFVPALKERGFKGSFPHFRRIKPDKIDLLTVQFDRWGGGFVIEIAKCGPEGITTSWGLHIPPSKVRAWDVNNPRPRLGAPAPGEDGIWFRYDDGTPVEKVARRVLTYLPGADDFWNT